MRIGMFLEIATTVGAITGAFIGGFLNPKYLFIIFSILMFYSTFMMIKKSGAELPQNVIQDPLADKLNLYPTAGSDYHGGNRQTAGLGVVVSEEFLPWARLGVHL